MSPLPNPAHGSSSHSPNSVYFECRYHMKSFTLSFNSLAFVTLPLLHVEAFALPSANHWMLVFIFPLGEKKSKIIDHFPIVFWIILKIHFSQNKLFPCPIHDVNPTFIKSFPLNRMINSIKVNYTPLLCVAGTSLPVTSLQFSSLPSQLLKHWLTPSFSVLHSSQRHKSEWTTSNLRFCLNHIAFSLLPLEVVWMFHCLFPSFILP